MNQNRESDISVFFFCRAQSANEIEPAGHVNLAFQDVKKIHISQEIFRGVFFVARVRQPLRDVRT